MSIETLVIAEVLDVAIQGLKQAMTANALALKMQAEGRTELTVEETKELLAQAFAAQARFNNLVSGAEEPPTA